MHLAAAVVQFPSLGKRPALPSATTCSSAKFFQKRDSPLWTGSYATSRRPSSSRVDVHTAVEAETDLQTHTETEMFNWFKYWWPVQLCANLDTDRPNRIQLLGEFFAVWMNKEGEWVAMRDMCPHRLAPLSEGRIESDGTLMCSYHGWRFNSCGKCVKIPQADSDKAHEAACNNPRSEAQTLPCQVVGGVLWIWPDSSESSDVESRDVPLPVPADYLELLERQIEAGQVPGLVAHVPYGYDVLMENVMDPSHLPFSHHGVMPGMDRYKGRNLDLKEAAPELPNAEDAAEYYTPSGGRKVHHMERIGPNCVVGLYEQEQADVSRGGISFLASPVMHDRTALFVYGIRPGALSGNEQPIGFVFDFILRNFRWYIHLAALKLLDGDSIFLYGQDTHVRSPKTGPWTSELCYMPTSADTPISKFRTWLATKGGGGPFGYVRSESRDETLNRKQLLDRQQLHVAHCKECQRGQKFVNRVVSVFEFLSRGLLLLAGFVLVQGLKQGVLSKWKLAVALVGCAFCAYLERGLKQNILPQFHFIDYVHAEKN